MPVNFLDYARLGMGNAKSKPKGHFGRTRKEPSDGRDSRQSESPREEAFAAEISDRFVEDPELKLLRYTIQYDPEIFVLNNLMMCVQFFENFEEEMADIRNTLVSSREADLNARLPAHKHALIPDVLQQHVARRVDFTCIDPTLKITIELLHPIRIYVAFDNIEVTEENFSSPYCSVNETIVYSMQLKPSPSHKGYVLLQRLDVNPAKKAISVDELDLSSMSNGTRDEIYSDGDSLYGTKSTTSCTDTSQRSDKDNESIYGMRRYNSQGNLFDYPSKSRAKEESIYGCSSKPENSRRAPKETSTGKRLLRSANGSPAGSTSSGYRSGNYMESVSDYSYAKTTYTTPKTSKSSLDSGSLHSSTEIPRQCFRKIVYAPDGKIYDARREKNQKMSSKEQLIRQAYKSRNVNVFYLNSTKFMKHFCHLFSDRLAEPMGFDPDIKDCVQGGVICQTKVEVLEGTTSTKLEQFEIVPSVTSEWPECAQEWLVRPRATWPNYDVIEKVKEFGCHMVPEGIPPDKPDRYSDLEWQLVFPAAERYLETCLSYPQVRVYLIALMLQKTFIRAVDSIFGLSVAHIKNRLFWLVEEDAGLSSWTENRTGEALIRLLKSIYRSISQDTPSLPDYFVRDKNLFQEKSYLLRTQKQLKRILENPVMYVFHALENIRHSRRFFPRINFEELFRLLTANSFALVHPHLQSHVSRQIPRQNNAENDYDRVGGIWDDLEDTDAERKKAYARKQVTKRRLINPKQAFDQVVEIPIRCEKMDPERTSRLLDFFIRHFIKMAEACHNYRALPQKMAYVDQAERLSVLLLEHPARKSVALTYLEKLGGLKKRPVPSRSQIPNSKSQPQELPETPKRNLDRAIFTKLLKNRYENYEKLESKQKFAETPEPKESKGYESDGSAGSIYSLQPPPGPRVDRTVETVTVHVEEEKKAEVRNTETSSDKAASTSRSERAISIDGNKSLEEETTYV